MKLSMNAAEALVVAIWPAIGLAYLCWVFRANARNDQPSNDP